MTCGAVLTRVGFWGEVDGRRPRRTSNGRLTEGKMGRWIRGLCCSQAAPLPPALVEGPIGPDGCSSGRALELEFSGWSWVPVFSDLWRREPPKITALPQTFWSCSRPSWTTSPRTLTTLTHRSPISLAIFRPSAVPSATGLRTETSTVYIMQYSLEHSKSYVLAHLHLHLHHAPVARLFHAMEPCAHLRLCHAGCHDRGQGPVAQSWGGACRDIMGLAAHHHHSAPPLPPPHRRR